MGKRRREQLNADAERLQVQRLGELVDRENALLLSDFPAQYQAAFDQPLRTESKLRKYLEGLSRLRALRGRQARHALSAAQGPNNRKRRRAARSGRRPRTSLVSNRHHNRSPSSIPCAGPRRRCKNYMTRSSRSEMWWRRPQRSGRRARTPFGRWSGRPESCWPHCEAKVFGSALTKLELPSSDVDVVVFGAPVDKGSGGVAKRLRTLASALEDLGAIAPRCVIPRPFVRRRRGVRGGGVPVG